MPGRSAHTLARREFKSRPTEEWRQGAQEGVDPYVAEQERRTVSGDLHRIDHGIEDGVIPAQPHTAHLLFEWPEQFTNSCSNRHGGTASVAQLRPQLVMLPRSLVLHTNGEKKIRNEKD